MKPSEVFGMIAPTLGLLLVLSSIGALAYALGDLALGGRGIGWIVWLSYGMSSMTTGLLLLLLAAFGLSRPGLSKRLRGR